MDTHHAVIAGLESPFLNEDRRHRAASLVQLPFHDGTASSLVRVSLQVHNVGLEQHHFQQLFQVQPFLGRDLHHGGVATPFFGDQPLLGEFPFDPFRIGIGLVDLVDGHDDGNPGRLGVIDRLLGLGHDAIVGGDHEDDDVGDLRPPGSHGGESLMTRRIQEGDLPAVKLHVVGADMLGNPAGLAGNDVGLADGVQERSLTVINVSHDGNHRRTLQEALRLIGDELYDLVQVHRHVLDFISEVGGQD